MYAGMRVNTLWTFMHTRRVSHVDNPIGRQENSNCHRNCQRATNRRAMITRELWLDHGQPWFVSRANISRLITIKHGVVIDHEQTSLAG